MSAPYLYLRITKYNSHVFNTARGTEMHQIVRCSQLRVRRFDRQYMNHYNISSEFWILLNSLYAHSISEPTCTLLPYWSTCINTLHVRNNLLHHKITYISNRYSVKFVILWPSYFTQQNKRASKVYIMGESTLPLVLFIQWRKQKKLKQGTKDHS